MQNMGMEVLKSVKGGYNKAAVLAKLDAYNAILFMAEDGSASPETLSAELEKAGALELTREKSGFFGKYGFSVEDTDAYLADLMAKIKQKAGL